ncbi:NYN domain-containing protein [Sagittula sp. SSi028]|uniref:NYN domain-containing protein n=1 Tax=Sagittula sp. SSi028 TaxID=3400636 RepID=UPI003AF94C41
MNTFVAVLVDGDNISGKYAEEILSIAAQYGVLQVVRVYCDVRRNGEWHDAMGYRMQHAGIGKNAADLLLAVDAMELSLANGIGCFVIATSDGDFSHVATRLRERRGKVIGIGEAKAPMGFRGCCSDFVEIGVRTRQVVPEVSSFASVLDKRIHAVISEHSKNGGGGAFAISGYRCIGVTGCASARIRRVGGDICVRGRRYMTLTPEVRMR